MYSSKPESLEFLVRIISCRKELSHTASLRQYSLNPQWQITGVHSTHKHHECIMVKHIEGGP